MKKAILLSILGLAAAGVIVYRKFYQWEQV